MQHLFNSRSRRLCKSRPHSICLPPLPGALPCLPMFLLLLRLATLLIVRRPSMSGLTLVCKIGDGFVIDPGQTLSEHPLSIQAKPIDSCLVLGGVLESILLRVGGEWKLNFGLAPVVVRHDDDGKKDRRQEHLNPPYIQSAS